MACSALHHRAQLLTHIYYIQAREREEAERLRRVHTFHARPVPRSMRASAAARLNADAVRPTTKARPFNLSGSRIPAPTSVSSDVGPQQRHSVHGVVTPHGAESRFAYGLRSGS